MMELVTIDGRFVIRVGGAKMVHKTDIDDEMRGDGFIFWWGDHCTRQWQFLVPRSATTMRTRGTETALGRICHSRDIYSGVWNNFSPGITPSWSAILSFF